MSLPALLLRQKPPIKSKAKEHGSALDRQPKWWIEGERFKGDLGNHAQSTRGQFNNIC